MTAPDLRESVDARLALGAVVAWVAAYLAVDDAGSGGALLGAVVALVGGAALLWGARRLPVRGRVWARACALAGACTALVLLPLAGRLAHAAQSPLHVLASRHASVSLVVTVTADPRVLAAKGPAGAPRVAVEASAESVIAGRSLVEVDGSLLVLADAAPWRDVLPGQRVRLDGELSPDLKGGVLSVTVFERGPPQLIGDPPWWQRAAGNVRTSLRQAAGVLPDQERGLLPGLVDGDTANLDPVLAEHFRTAGLTHLVAVSGATAGQ